MRSIEKLRAPLPAQEQTSRQNARADLLRLISGFQVSQAIHVATSLGLPDLLQSRACTIQELATKTETEPSSLYRLMRALASVGVFHEDDKRRFSLTPMSEFLRSDVEGTHEPMALMMGRSSYWRSWGELAHAVRTGKTAFDHIYRCDVWAYRAEHPEEARVFDRAMASLSKGHAQAVIDAYDFGRFRHLVDVGGGDGTFLAEILAAHPHLRGTLFDQPHVAREAEALITRAGMAARCESIGGDFFAGVSEGGDLYMLKWILHDWDDAAAVDVLNACRRAMKPDSRLLVVELLIGAPNTAPAEKFMDLNMMVMTGGRERTREEFAALFARAGVQLRLSASYGGAGQRY